MPKIQSPGNRTAENSASGEIALEGSRPPRRLLSAGDQEEMAFQLAQAQQLLGDVLDYLRRLPPVPVTIDFVERVERGLSAPASAFVRESVAAERAAQGDLYADVWTDDSRPLIAASLVDRVLTIRCPEVDIRRTHARRVLENLARGWRLELAPRRTSR